ncbi:MAG TPA: Rne/Rng family ribonuclease [Jatrophihabitans sp.]|nr:Rne/Rng family ribonuclease [Jatrophihabitans sp.]
MLDTEPTDNASTTTENSLDGSPATGSDQPAAPAKKAARKAPAKRAPRKAKAAAPAAPADEAPAAVAEPAPTAEPQDDTAAAPAPAKKVARKRVAKKATPPAALPETDSPAGLAAEPAAGEPAIADTAATAEQPVEPPVKKATRKRVSKKAAAAAAEPAAPDATAATEAGEAPTPVLAAPAVLFQPPVEAKPTRRRRGKAAAEPAAQDVDTGTAADEEQPELVAATPEAESAESAEQSTDTESAEHADDTGGPRRRRRRGRRGRGRGQAGESADSPDSAQSTETGGAEAEADEDEDEEASSEHADEVAEAALSASARRRRRRRRSSGSDDDNGEDDPPNTVVHVRDSRSRGADDDGVRGVKGSTRLEAKRQRRRDNRDSGRRRAPILTEAEFLARREAVTRVMAVRQTGDRTQIAVLEDDVLVEHYVTRASAASAVGNVYLGRVQNVLPSMEAAFVDIGRGRNGVLYAGEVNWDSAGLEGKARSIENALSPGDSVLVQVTKDPIGHKGARLTSQVSLPGRFVVYVPGGGMTGISRKLPDTERSRLKSILKKVVPDEAGVIVRTAAEGASEQDLISDVERLKAEWENIAQKAERKSDGPQLVHGEPDLAIRVVRDIFNDDFSKLIVDGSQMHATLSSYVRDIAPELAARISLHTAETDLFRDLRVDEQLAKALDRKVWLPSGGSLVIDRTEAMTVIDVNTGKYTGSGGNLEQTVTRNNLEAAEEIVRQLRLRDLGGIVVIDFIDMVLESNRELVLRRLTECLGRDRTKHQVAEVTSLGLVQMTRKRVGEGLLEAFSEPCEHCHGRGIIVHMEPVDRKSGGNQQQHNHGEEERTGRSRRSRGTKAKAAPEPVDHEAETSKRRAAASAIAAIAAATTHHEEAGSLSNVTEPDSGEQGAVEPDGAQPDGAQQESVQQVGTGEQPTAAAQPDVAPPTARPRRRRAASRPAGPPVHAS